MAYSIDARPSAGIPTEVHSTQLNPVGMIREFSDGWYIYLAGATSMAAGDWVSYVPGTYTAIRHTTTGRGQVAIATSAVDAATKWGWFGIEGSFTANCLSACTSNTPIYASGTAGSATHTLTKNCQIKKAHATGAPVTSTGGGSQVVVLARPFIGSYDESV